MEGRRKNTFKKAIRHLKSNQIDEKLQVLSEIPTNNTSGIYIVEPEYYVQDPDVPGSEPVDFTQDDPDLNGRDTTGLFGTDGSILTIEPDVGDTSYILGPMASMWYAWGNFSTIGYIRESDRRMVDLGRITGRLGSWDGSSNFTSYGQLTLEQAVWFRDTPKLNGADNDTPNYRAFYPGPPSTTRDEFGRYLCVITGTPKPTSYTPPPRRVPPEMGGFDPNILPGSANPFNLGSLLQLGARLLRSFTDAARFSGDYMFKGIKAGVEYLPDFTGAAPKSLGGKKWADVFGPLGKALAGKNYASQYFTPSLNKALDYAKEGGTIVVMPRTGGVRGFKNWFGSSVSRGFGIGDIEKLVRTSDTIKSAQQGTTQIFNSADPKSMEALKKLAASGSKANTMLGKLGRAVPFVGAAAAVADVSMRLNKGDYTGAVLGGVSAIPGPIGWIGLGSQVLYDTAVPGWLKDSVNRGVKRAYVDPANQGMQNMMNTGNMSRSGGVPTGTGTLLNFGVEYEINSNQRFLNEQVDYDEYRNSMRTALFELGVPTDRKQFAKEQGTYLTLLGVNPDLVSILTLIMAGEELSSEQKKWIDDNLINMVKVFSNLRDEQEQNPKTQKESNQLLSESRKKILKSIKKPYVLPEESKQKYKIKPNVIGKNRTINSDLMKKAEVPTSFKPMEDKMWGKYEKEQNIRLSQERKNEILDHLGGSDHAWGYMTETSRKKNNDIMYSNFGETQKKGKVVRREEVKGDTLLFISDENGKKEIILQSELSIRLADEFNKKLFEKYFQEQETLDASRDSLFNRISKKLKSTIDDSDKPSKNGYPDNPPPEMVNGMHPDLVDGKKVADRFNRLDPQSARAMPLTGNPHIDKKVKAARKQPK